MSNLKQRTITGAMIGLVMVLGILVNQWTFFFLFLTIIAFTLWEFFGLPEEGRPVRPQKVGGTMVGVSIFMLNFFYAMGEASLEDFAIIIPLFVVLYIVELFRNAETPFANLAQTFLGIVFLALPFSALCYLAFIPSVQEPGVTGFFKKMATVGGPNSYNFHVLMGYFLILWAYDSFAYFFGVRFGKHRLFERVSPKKSWEGAILGGLSAVVFSGLLSIFFKELTLIQWFGFGLTVVIFATFGDLVESLIKRDMGVKDSGDVLPGHGGLLDRFDSILLSAPMVVFYIKFIIEK